MPVQTIKVAISLPKEEFRALEKRRRKLKQTRSAVVTEAIRYWLKAQEEAEDVRRYIEGYQKHPETKEEMVFCEKAGVEVLAETVWEEK